ncbi:hypothetical protein QTA58_16000 [Neorhizobium sp. CSC1952]|uniref:hypothetical protein n=1 Tax=Neorhizobium sp. CSC1952 TaxID=2978974 RepID=UPI0025A58B13|nr:hypothetical protein [Rhizobium sp. CSC1952]WJR65726.1 hypothetical protein QTA58_16000 [Rhizobium sp. CSC1952]
MADFVAVIRRAVDGLANNTPEMRAKVYDKARGAVQRQLENMKPRPPEDMLRRQMEKLEAAIMDVESEHAEALEPLAEEEAAAIPQPAEEAPAEHHAEEPAAGHAAEEPVSEEPPEQAAAEPHVEEQEAAPDQTAETHEPEPVEAETAPLHHDERHEEPVQADVHAEAAEPEPAVFHEEAAPVPEEPAPPKYGDWRDDLPPEEPEAASSAYDRQEPAEAFGEGAEQAVPASASDPVTPEPATAHWGAPEPDGEQQPADAPGPAGDWGWERPASGHEANAAAAVWNDVPELTPAGPVVPIDHGAKAEAADAHFGTETHAAADAVRMPSVSDLPDLPPSPAKAATANADPFADYAEPQKANGKPAESDPWGDLEELIGFNKNATQGDSSRNAMHTDADADDLMPAPARPYRVTPVRKRNYAGIVLAIIGLALVGAGGYAIWLNRDSLNDMVGGLIQSSLPASQTAEQADNQATAPAPATPQPGATPSTPAPAPQNNAANPAAPAAPGPADGSVAGTKFTQRLMPDGSETDEGPGSTGDLAQNAEGQSVAELNAPPATPPAQQAPAASAPASDTPAAGANAAVPNAASPAPNAPAATPADAPALAGEKMFLYEERIGQTAPTAIDGAVSWSLQREAGANGQQEPVIQGRINVPGRGLTALVTLKRNTDPSLPASHLIEIVFAVPPDFEGGAIDSVQRIAMKQTEQDRGNALIAVPAKITDDFHMIALNDFPDARTTNLELLRSRNWMDIPVAYRNGRRALLTLQKGPEGERVFNEAIREWGTLGTTASGQ